MCWRGAAAWPPAGLACDAPGARRRRLRTRAGGSAEPPEPGRRDLYRLAGTWRSCVLVADCVPVLIADPVARLVGAAHAGREGLVGWGGARAGRGDDAGRAPDPARMRAVTGPPICGGCYEVPAQMRDQVARSCRPRAATTRQGTAGLDIAGRRARPAGRAPGSAGSPTDGPVHGGVAPSCTPTGGTAVPAGSPG